MWLRQTNVVWVAAFAALDLLLELKAEEQTMIEDPPSSEISVKGGSASCSQKELTEVACYVLVLSTFQQIKIAPYKTALVLLPYLPLGIFAASFILINGSIVLGKQQFVALADN